MVYDHWSHVSHLQLYVLYINMVKKNTYKKKYAHRYIYIYLYIYIYYMYNNVFKFEGQLSFRHRWTVLALILVTLGKFVVKLLTSNEAVQDITALWAAAAVESGAVRRRSGDGKENNNNRDPRDVF